MVQHVSYKIPKFDGMNYSFWKLGMESNLNSMRFGIWNSVVNGYIAPSTPPITLSDIKTHENNGKERNANVSGFLDLKLLKVMN